MPKTTNSACPTSKTSKPSTSKTSTTTKTSKTSKTSTTSYTSNGVNVTPTKFTSGDRIKLTYNGLLAQSGALEIYAHVGYGASKWQNVTDIKMTQTKNGFEATLPISSASNLNIAFKDSINNWDNNSGNNYCFKANK